MFAHEKLQVYRRALDFAAQAASWTNNWDKKHALVDHLSRATESILVNLAEAARQRGAPARLRIVDYAIGSSLEEKALLAEKEAGAGKEMLRRISAMVAGF